jgi:hypothetical protein
LGSQILVSTISQILELPRHEDAGVKVGGIVTISTIMDFTTGGIEIDI